MSTRAAIINENPNGAIGIYCHSDGYPSWLGYMLATHFNTPAKVMELIGMGDISGIGRDGTVEDYHSRGDEDWDDVCPICGKDANEVADLVGHDKHVYVYRDGEWYHNGTPLATVLAQPEIAADVAKLHNL